MAGHRTEIIFNNCVKYIKSMFYNLLNWKILIKMKKVTSFLIALFMSISLLSQVPQSLKYQTVVRNNAGDIVASQNISFRMIILQGELPGTVVYVETHYTTTNATGLATIEIGRGTPVTGSFATINWSTTPIFLKTGIDPAGGSSFVEMGTSELLSVPYALHSQSTESFAETDPEFNAWDKSTGITIAENQITDLQDYLTEEVDGDPTNELQTVTENDYQVTLSQGGGSFMTGVKSYTQAEIDVMTPYNGLTVHNATTNCINYYYLNNWFEACGTCTPQPTQANAGSDQNFTSNTTSTTLDGIIPTHGAGFWTVQTGEGGSFDDASNSATTFIGQPCTSYILAWTITNTCGASSDLVNIVFNHTPSIPDAGPDQIGIVGNTTTLAGNTPEQGTGLWAIVSGEGGILGDPSSPNSSFTGVPTTDYTLSWTINTTCASLSDNVNIRFWSCGLPITDERDNKTYNTVQIGPHCWMAQNLNVGTSIAGTTTSANNGIIEKYCYSNSDAQCDVYGGLYQWYEMMNYTTTAGVQGICPTGWHLPTDDEWTALTTNLGGESVAGGKMKEVGTAHWNSPNSGATNSSGFSCLPGGYRGTNGTFTNIGYVGYFWSSTEYSTTSAWVRTLSYNNTNVTRYYYGDKDYGFSVRCLSDF